jgi:hypothetical protein
MLTKAIQHNTHTTANAFTSSSFEVITFQFSNYAAVKFSAVAGATKLL